MPSSTFEQAALALDSEITRQLTTVIDKLAADAIPSSIIAHSMRRLGCTMIRDAEGRTQLVQSVDEIVRALTH
jgi:ABC-type arginine transport system ATPase subunit